MKELKISDNENFTFNVTNSAFERISKISNSNQKLRIKVDGGGCSGFSYKYEVVEDVNNEDYLIEKNGIAVIIDKLSQTFLSGSTLDFIDTLGNAYFEIRNPKAKSKCGCGNSFDF